MQRAGGRLGGGPATVEVRRTVTTTAAAAEVLAEVDALGRAHGVVVDRGQTYVVLSTRRRRYTAGSAVALVAVGVLAVLVLSAVNVVLIALLPAALLPLAPLLFDERPMLAVGAVPGEGGTPVVVHGMAWDGLLEPLTALLDRLPPVPAEVDEPASQPASV